MGRTDLRVAAVTAAAFAVLTALVVAGWAPLVELDRSVAGAANSWAAGNPGEVRVLKIGTNVAGPLTWRLLAIGLAIVLLVRRAVGAAVFTFAVIVIGGVVSTAVKVAVDRARPVVPHPYANAAGMSFPSGHACTATLACGIALMLLLPRLRRGWRAAAWLLAAIVPVAVGCTRIGLDVHWVSDVVGGWLLGVAVLAAAHAAVLRPRAGASPVSTGPARMAALLRRSGRS